jgi:hypothetical protein
MALPLQAQMTFDGSGNVGIGTDTPSNKLDVNGTANMTTLAIGGTAVTATAAELNYVDGVTSSIQSQINAKAATASPTFSGTVTLPGDGRWNSSGNVGIGTTNPAEKLTLTDGNFLQTLGNPTHAAAIFDNNTTALDSASSIYVAGKYAYIASFNDGVEILDVSDPTNPTHVGAIFDNNTTALGGASSIVVAGKYAYVAAYTDGVEILDISDPTNPTHVGAIFDNGTTALAGAYSIYVAGKYAYVAARDDDGVEIIDISDPTNPTHVGAITDNDTTALDGAISIYVVGKYAYITALSDSGVEILDISDPTNPTHVGAVFGSAYFGGANYIYVAGKYAYVAAGYDDAIEILDISDPSNPTHAGSISDDSSTALDYVNSIFIAGKYAYVTAYNDDGVEILDISGIDAPTASIGAVAANSLDVSENAQIGNNLSVNGGLNVGAGGLKTDGPVSIYADTDNDGTTGVLKIANPHQFMVFDGNEIDSKTEMHLNHNSSGDIYLVNGGGKVGIGTGFTSLTYALQVGTYGDGTEARANAWNAYSDRRLKKNITPINNPLTLLEEINGVYFNWKEGSDESRQVGVIAQEVEKVLPEVVSTDDDGYKSVDYGKISALLVEAVKELKKQNERLQEENRKIKQEIKALQEASRM